MDVRCEKCQTEYELDEAKVTEAGVTVKCTTCGNLFKIRKRAGSMAAPLPLPDASQQGGEGDRLWLIRSPRGEIQRFRELTTLQQWIVEQKVTRECEISRTGETWKRLGDIAELASFFMVVEQAQTSAKPEQRPGQRKSTLPMGGPPVVRPGPTPPQAQPVPRPPTGGPATTAKPAPFGDPTVPLKALSDGMPPPRTVMPAPRPAMPPPSSSGSSEPSGPTGGMGGASSTSEPAWATPSSAKGNRAALDNMQQPPTFTALNRADLSMAGDDFDAYRPPKSRIGFFALAIVLVAGAGVAVYWFAIRPKSGTAPTAPAPTAPAPVAQPTPIAPTPIPIEPKVTPVPAPAETPQGKAYREAMLAFQRDDLDAAEKLLEQARGGTPADEARTLASQALVHAARADWLGVDAAAIKPSSRTRAKALEADAAKALARADKLAREAQVEDPRSPEAAVALADVKRQQKKKAAEVERHLDGLTLAEAHYVRGRLRARDGKTADAIQELSAAAEGAKTAAGVEHVRARWHLASLYLADKRWADARTELDRIGDAPRAATLKAEIARQEGLAAPPAAVPRDPKDGDDDLTGPLTADAYDGLVSKGDKLAIGGKCTDAKKYYERALDARPGGVEALVGLGYCFLDAKDYGRAIANFRAALGISPRFGDALIGIAEAHRFSGNKDEALKYYEKYLDAHPTGSKAGIARRGLDALGDGGTTPPPDPKPEPKPETVPPDVSPPKDPPPADPPKEEKPPEPTPAEPPAPAPEKTETPP